MKTADERLDEILHIATSVLQDADYENVILLSRSIIELSADLIRGVELPRRWLGAADDPRAFLISRSELTKLLQDNARLLAQVTATQTANTDLVEKNRILQARLNYLEQRMGGLL